MIFAGIYKNELSVIDVFPSIQCFCLNISEMNRFESTSYSVLITRGISHYTISRSRGTSARGRMGACVSDNKIMKFNDSQHQ